MSNLLKSRFLQILAYLMLIPIFIFLIGAINDCGRVTTMPTEGYSRGDTIDIAILYVPGSFYTYDDSISGINYELAHKFEEETSIPLKIWPVADAATALGKLKDGAFDILASLPLDNTLKRNFTISESVFLDRLVLVQTVDSLNGKKAVNSTLDLDDKIVYVAQGSSAYTRMHNLSDEIGGNITVEEVPDLSDELICLKVATGAYPLAVVNEKTAKKIAESYPNLKYDSSVSFTQFQVWVFNPEDSVTANRFNSWFESFRTSDSYREIINSY